VYYALDESDRQGFLDRIAAEKKPGKITVQRFKGLGEMNPSQLRETTMVEETRRLVCLRPSKTETTHELLDMLFAKKRAGDRKTWLEKTGDKAELI
jgi:topoisomerase-4 subunit B